MLKNKILLITVLGFVAVQSETPCSHNVVHDNKVPEASNSAPKYEPAPSASISSPEFLSREYLPPNDFQLPSANQPVYVAPPVQQKPVAPLPKLQPLPQATYVKPVYQPLPKLQPVKPAYQPQPQPTFVYQAQPSTVQPKLVPLPKLQPLPSNEQPKYVPLPSTPRPVVTQTFPPSTLKPLPALPKYSPAPLPNIQPFVPPKQFALPPKQVIVPKITAQPKENDVQATNVQTRIVKPDLETAAQTNGLSFVDPKIKINHYICEQGSTDQKFLCDIFRLWDHHHPPTQEIITNDLDNPGDNSINNPTYAQLPTTSRPTFAPSTIRPVTYTVPSTYRPVTYAPTTARPVTYAPTTTTTTTPEPEKDFENIPGDSQHNENAIYLPPYSTTSEPTISSTEPSTVEIPRRPTTNEVTPEETETSAVYNTPSTTPYPTTSAPTTTTTTVAPKEGYDYPKPVVPFPVPEKQGYDYPKPAIPFSDGISYSSSFSSIPLSGPASFVGSSYSFDSAKSSFPSFSNSLGQFSAGYSPFGSLSSPVVTSTTIAPEVFFKSNSELFNSPAFSYQSVQPLQQVTTISPYSVSTPAPLPIVSYSSVPEIKSFPTLAPSIPSSQIVTTTVSPIEKSSVVTTEGPAVSTTTYSTPLPESLNSQFFGSQYFNSLSPVSYNLPSFGPSIGSISPISYSFPSYEQSISSAAPISYGFDNSLSGFNSFNYQPLSLRISPAQGVSETSSEKSVTTTSATPTVSSFNSQTFGLPSLNLEKNKISTEKSTVSTTTAATPIETSQNIQSFGQYFNSLPPSFGYSFQPLGQSVSTVAPLTYNFDNSLSSNYSSFAYQPASGPAVLGQPAPISYSFQPLGQTIVSGQSYSFPSSFSSGSSSFNSGVSSYSSSLPSSSFSSDLPSPSFSSGLPSPSFSSGLPSPSFSSGLPSPSFSSGLPSPTFDSGSSIYNSGFSSFSSGLPSSSFYPSGPSSLNLQSIGQSENSISSTTPSLLPNGQYQKSGLSFGSNVQSVENLKNLPSATKPFDLDIRIGKSQDKNQFAATFSDSRVQEAPKQQTDSKEDISLGNIEILKVKRKSSHKQ